MQSITFEVANKLVSYVRDHPGAKLEQVVQNVPELADVNIRDFAIDGCPFNHDSLIIVDNERRVYLGDKAYLVEQEALETKDSTNSNRRVLDVDKVSEEKGEQN